MLDGHQRVRGASLSDDVQMCDNCGGEIIFRRICGSPVPIHLSGGCWGSPGGSGHASASGSVPSSPSWPAHVGYRSSLRDLAAELGYSIVVKACCWDCGEEVYLLAKPDGGFVILDELGPGWQVHPCYRGGRASGSHSRTQAADAKPSLLACSTAFRFPVPAGLHETRAFREGQSIRATVVAVEGREVLLCDGLHVYRLVLRGPGRLGECVEGYVRRRGLHWELSAQTVVQPLEPG